MKTVALNHAESARWVGRVTGSGPETENLDLLGGGLRDVYEDALSPMPDHLLALARHIDARCAKASHAD